MPAAIQSALSCKGGTAQVRGDLRFRLYILALLAWRLHDLKRWCAYAWLRCRTGAAAAPARRRRLRAR